MSSSSPLTKEQLQRVARLRTEMVMLEDRYGVERPAEIARLERSLQRRSSRIETLTGRLDEIIDELMQLETERSGLLTGMEMLLSDHLATTRIAKDEAWSPWAIPGYRIWGVTSSGMVGMSEPWPEPRFEATCAKLPSNPDVPHTDDRCRAPQCGIYAAKRARPVLPRAPSEGGWAIGLVSLRGKVVEHEHGYRAARAEVEAVVVHHAGRVLAAEEPRMIELAFSATAAATALLGRPEAEWPIERTLTTLYAAERRLEWTSDPSIG